MMGRAKGVLVLARNLTKKSADADMHDFSFSFFSSLSPFFIIFFFLPCSIDFEFTGRNILAIDYTRMVWRIGSRKRMGTVL